VSLNYDLIISAVADLCSRFILSAKKRFTFTECVRNGGFRTVVSATVVSVFGCWRAFVHIN
jgi:hypothetical protein